MTYTPQYSHTLNSKAQFNWAFKGAAASVPQSKNQRLSTLLQCLQQGSCVGCGIPPKTNPTVTFLSSSGANRMRREWSRFATAYIHNLIRVKYNLLLPRMLYDLPSLWFMHSVSENYELKWIPTQPSHCKPILTTCASSKREFHPIFRIHAAENA